MADRTIRLRLKLETDDLKRQLAEAARAMDKVPESAAKAETALGRMVQSARYNRESWDRAGQTMLAFGAATVGGLALSAKAAIDWESAWTGVLKTVNGTDSQLDALEDSLREMARTLPATHEEIAAVAEAAGQLGIQTPNVAAFTRTMIDLGETTNLSAQEAATGLARFSNVMGTSQQDVGRLGSVIVGLGNNFATTEREILDMAQRLSAAGRVVGLTEADVLALAASMSSVGIEAEAGGTAVSRVMIKISAAVDQGGSDLDEFARAAGMSSTDFAEKWRSAPVDALLAVVGGLARMTATGEGTFSMLEELGFQDVRVTNAMLSLSNATELTSSAVAMANTEWTRNAALLLEAQKRYETTQARLDVAKNSITDAAIELGQVFLPAIGDAADGVADFASWLGSLPDPIKQAVGGVGALAGGVGVLGGSFLLLFPRIVDTITRFRTLGTTAQATLKGIGATTALVAAAAALLKVADAAQTASVSGEDVLNRLIAIEEGAARIDELFSDIGQGWADDLSLVGKLDTGTVDDFRDSLDRLGDARPLGWASDFTNMMDDIAGLDGGLRQFGIRVRAVGGELGSLAQRDLPRAQTQFNLLVDAAGGGEEAVGLLLDQMPAYRDALYQVANAQGLALDETSLLAAATGELSLGTETAVETTTALGDTTQYVGQSTEEATAALAEWRTMVVAADAAFIDLSGAYQGVIDQNMAYAQSTADATEKSTDSWEDYYDGVTVSSADYIAQLQAQVDAQTAWETNMTALTTKAREGMTSEMADAADAMIDELMALGPEGAAQVALMASMTDEEFVQVVTLWGQKGTAATDAFVASVETHAPPVIQLAADPASAYAVVESFRRTVSGMTVYMNVAGQEVGFSTGRGNPTGRAFGGPVPGSAPHPRADNVLIRATPGEFVHQVPAVNYWGRGFMDSVNRMDKAAVAASVQGLAYGGGVGYVQGYMQGLGAGPSGPGVVRQGARLSVVVQANEPLAQAYAASVAERIETRLRDALAVEGLDLAGGLS